MIYFFDTNAVKYYDTENGSQNISDKIKKALKEESAIFISHITYYEVIAVVNLFVRSNQHPIGRNDADGIIETFKKDNNDLFFTLDHDNGDLTDTENLIIDNFLR